MIARYEVEGKEWVGNQRLSLGDCDEVRWAIEFIYDTLCSYQEMNDFPDVDEAFCKVYVALKFLKPGVESHDN